ncbi:hypothetical protein ABK040_008759 [Willaertia magna]
MSQQPNYPPPNNNNNNHMTTSLLVGEEKRNNGEEDRNNSSEINRRKIDEQQQLMDISMLGPITTQENLINTTIVENDNDISLKDNNQVGVSRPDKRKDKNLENMMKDDSMILMNEEQNNNYQNTTNTGFLCFDSIEEDDDEDYEDNDENYHLEEHHLENSNFYEDERDLQTFYENHPLAKDFPLKEYYIEGSVFKLPPRYEPIECVGKGAYGIVVSANDKLLERKVAIKKIDGVFKKEKFFQKRIFREIEILMHCKGHPNIVEILDLIQPESIDEFDDIYIVTEFMDCNLQELLKSGQKFSEQNIQYFLYQMLKALDVLHSCDIVHRDIKSSNILVNNDYEVKYCDFGLSRGMMNEKMSTDNVATRWYRSPELLLKYHKAGKPIDVWSLGCVFAELLATPKQHVLFPGESHLNQIDKILDILGTPIQEDIFGCFKAQVYMQNQPFRKKKDFSKLFPDANPAALDLLEKQLAFSPVKRITVKDALKHPYLESMLNQMEDEEHNGFVVKPFEFRFDENWDVPLIKKMMYDEVVKFHEKVKFKG